MRLGYKLWRLIRDHAPQDWTSGELVVAGMIADSANETTLISYITSELLAERSRMGERGVRANLEKLAGRGFEFRVQIGTDRHGKAVYGIPGKDVKYQVPRIFTQLARASGVTHGLVDNQAGRPSATGLSTEEGGTTVPPRRNHSAALRGSMPLSFDLKPSQNHLNHNIRSHNLSWNRARDTEVIHRRTPMTEIAEQPAPLPNNTPDIQSLVIADIGTRRQVGIQRYGTPLQAHNGRDALRDAYEEALDLAMYLRQEIEERETAGQGDIIDAVLRDHYLTEVRCDHKNKLDNAICACSQIHLGWHPTVGQAVAAWIDHVKAKIAAKAEAMP